MQSSIRRALTATAATAAVALATAGLAPTSAQAVPVSPAPYTDCATVSANLIQNCGFETGDFTDWTVTPAYAGSFLSADPASADPPASAHTGSYAAVFESYMGVDDKISQTIPGTTPGHTYTVGYWADSVLVSSGNHFAVTVSNVQGGGTETFDEQQDVVANGGAPSGWIYNEDSFVAGTTDPTLSFSAYNKIGYWAVDDVTVVDQAVPQTITFTSTPPANPQRGDTYTVRATGGGSTNPVLFFTDPKSKGCTVTPDGVVTFPTTGTCLIDASQAAQLPHYLAARTVQQKVVVRTPQTITFTSTPPAHPVPVFNDAYTVTATGGASGNPVTFSTTSLGVCSIDNDAFDSASVSFTHAGRCVIMANQAGNAVFYRAATAKQIIRVYAS